MKRQKNLIEETSVVINGEEVNLKRFKAKSNKRGNNARSVLNFCPNCMSSMRLNKDGLFECTGDKLLLWEGDFQRFSKLEPEDKAKYIGNLSDYGRFVELYDKWLYSVQQNNPAEFNCGYSNVLYPSHGSVQIKIADPLFTKRLEEKLGRPLTEEELIGESELFMYGGRVLTTWRKRAIPIKIPWITLPSEETVYV
jgi:hypothetical protein